MSGGFALGAAVTWKSQAGGYKREKIGKVIAIIPPGSSEASRFVREAGKPRDETTYIVNAAGKLYWPRTKHLQAYKMGRG